MDFVHASDIIDLSAIDANTSSSGNQAFLYGGQNTAVVARSPDVVRKRWKTLLFRADVNGNTVADLQIVLQGTQL